MSKQGFVYIMTNQANLVLYTGVTSNLKQRVYQHKEKLIEGFTQKYNLTKLIHYEIADSIEGAILREKQIKDYSRKKKIQLIKEKNPDFLDLYKFL
jgi:putative endonuclease